MPKMQDVFKLNREDVAAKIIDDELIVVRLSDGTYYSMQNVGTYIWQLIEAGYDVQSTARCISNWYDAPIDDVSGDVDALINILLDEKLITATTDEGGPRETITPPEKDSLAYAPPEIGIYRDMGNLLALDPPTPGIDELMFGPAKDD